MVQIVPSLSTKYTRFRPGPAKALRSKSTPGRPWPIGCAGATKRSASMHTWANAVLELPHQLLEESVTVSCS